MELLFRACSSAPVEPEESIIMEKLTFRGDFASTADDPFTKIDSRSSDFRNSFENSFSSKNTIMDELYPLPTTSRIINKIQEPCDDVVCEDSYGPSLDYRKSCDSKSGSFFRQPKRTDEIGKKVSYLSGAGV